MDPKTGTKLPKTEVINEINKFAGDAEGEVDDIEDIHDESSRFYNYSSKSDLTICLIWT